MRKKTQVVLRFIVSLFFMLFSLAPHPTLGGQESPAIRILSYNVMGIPLPGVDHSRYAVIGQILKEQQDLGIAPDVVLLQEMFHERTRELIARAGYPFVVYGPKAKGIQISSGLVILSRYPVEWQGSGIYRSCVSWDCFARKGFVFARVRLPSGEGLLLGNTHLNADLESDPISSSHSPPRVRQEQLAEMKTWLPEAAKSEVILFGGDFNFRGDAPEKHDFLAWSGLLDANRFSEGNFDQSLDRFFLSPALAPRIRGMSYRFTEPDPRQSSQQREVQKGSIPGGRLSDHLAVLFELDGARQETQSALVEGQTN
jgi:endonuclease/exonuclease/phosphatase family metal-dependent hydrolase